MDARELAITLQKQHLDWMWSALEFTQRQNRHLVLAWMNSEAFPLGDQARTHTLKWMQIFQKSSDNFKESSETLLDKMASRISSLS